MSLKHLSAMALVLAVMQGPGAQAQDDPVPYDPDVLGGCLVHAAGPGARAACIGVGAHHCLMSEAGSSTVGVGFCYGAERDDWDARLNDIYAELLDQQAGLDAQNQEFNPNLPSGVETLRDMQRAWIAFRDAACDFEYAQWGGGTGAGPAGAECEMRLTARQALWLEGYLR